ncbi:MAG: acyl-CoA synthetase [Hyphomonas sp.]
MYLGTYAKKSPDKPAVINATTEAVLTYRELDDASNQFAQFLYAKGLRRGDHIALFMENNVKFFVVVWAAFRSGLYVTTINRYLTAEEAAYIANDCKAQALVTTFALREVATELSALICNCPYRLMTDGTIDGWENFEDTIGAYPTEKLAEEWRGDSMLYSSGTTGRPKGVKRPLADQKIYEAPGLQEDFQITENSIYLSPAPLYHAAPFAFTTGTLHKGATVVMMEKFDPVEALRCIEKYKITHSQWVPTMFIRMLKLNEEDRAGWDLSSHRIAVHAAAPCPVDIKRQMIDWWGPILIEYYAGSENNGTTIITSDEWLDHPGSVGRPENGILHICDDDGVELPAGERGTIYFEQEVMPFEYHNAPEKTRDAQHPLHPNWSTLGDIGYVDDEGYLYLTDRKAYMIISGGVNIYPQEIENALVLHHKVADVAVFGVPDPDMGEEVKAVVQVAPGETSNDALEAELIAWARKRLAHYKVPKTIDFMAELPRLPTGKLYKRILRDKYLEDLSV